MLRASSLRNTARSLRSLQQSTSIPTGHQLAAPLSAATSLRRFHPSRDPSYSYELTEINPPMNWGIRIVPQATAFVIERLGKYTQTLTSGNIGSLKAFFRFSRPHTVIGTVYDALGLYYGLGRTFFNPASAKVFSRLDSMRDALKNYTIDATPNDISSVLQQGGMFVFKGKELLYARKDEGTGDHAPLDDIVNICCRASASSTATA